MVHLSPENGSFVFGKWFGLRKNGLALRKNGLGCGKNAFPRVEKWFGCPEMALGLSSGKMLFLEWKNGLAIRPMTPPEKWFICVCIAIYSYILTYIYMNYFFQLKLGKGNKLKKASGPRVDFIHSGLKCVRM